MENTIKALLINPWARTAEIIEVAPDIDAWLELIDSPQYAGHKTLQIKAPNLTLIFDDNGLAARLPIFELRHPEYSNDNTRKQALPPRNPLDERRQLYDVRMEVPGKAIVIASDDEEEGRFLDVAQDIAKALRIRFIEAPRLAA